jgi:hypothetical protein
MAIRLPEKLGNRLLPFIGPAPAFFPFDNRLLALEVLGMVAVNSTMLPLGTKESAGILLKAEGRMKRSLLFCILLSAFTYDPRP